MKTKWGIIGTGTIAGKFAEAFEFAQFGELAGVYGRTQSKAEAFADQYKINSYTSMEDLLDDVEVVYIGTTNNSHYELAVKCIEHKTAVLLEKPFTLNLKQTKALQSLASEHDVYIMEALWTLHLPVMKQIKTWISEGKIGQIKNLTANFAITGDGNKNGRLYRNELGGGSLLDVGIYPLAFFNHFAASDIKKIHAHARLDNDVDTTCHFQIQYKNDILASGISSIEFSGENKAMIYGDKGHIEINNFWMAKSAILRGEETIEYEDDSPSLGYQYELDAVSQDLQQGKKENEIVSKEVTKSLSKTMDYVRAQIGLIYEVD